MKQSRPTAPALEKPRQPGRIRAVLLAAIVHAIFFALIVFGVTWQSSPTPPVEAELWDKLPPIAKKSEPARPDPPKPETKPEPPKPEPPKSEPPKPEPPKPEVKPPAPKPDPAIALKLEREKREKEKVDKKERERLEKQKEEEAKKQQREQEDAAKRKREDDKRRKDEEIAKKEAEKVRQASAAARQAEVDSWVEKIKAKIRGRANVPDTVSGSPQVHVRIRILPGGEVLDIAITKPSGNPSYDSAIERAIRSASPLPVPPSESELFPQFRDLNLQIRHER